MTLTIRRENPFGKHLRLELDRFGSTPGAYFILRTGSAPAIYLAYMRNIIQAPEENEAACRKAVEYLAEQGYPQVLISYFTVSPLERIFAKIAPAKVAEVENVYARLDAVDFKAQDPALRVVEVDYDDARLRAAYDGWIELGCDRLCARAPDLFFSTWRFDAYSSRHKPRLALDPRGNVVGAMVFWTEMTPYDPKTAIAFFCYPRATLESGGLEGLFRAGYAHLAGMGLTHSLACRDVEDAPLRALHAKYGFKKVEGPAGGFLCREYRAAPKPVG